MQYTNYPNYYQTQQQSTPRFMGLKGRPVASLDEVRGTTIDFDGSVFFFPDLANKRIYTKQINVDGTASLNVYELKNIPLDNPTGNYVTREEFEMALSQIQSLLTPPQMSVESNKANISTQF